MASTKEVMCFTCYSYCTRVSPRYLISYKWIPKELGEKEKKQALGKVTIDKNLVVTSICHNHIFAIIILLEIQTNIYKVIHPIYKTKSTKTTITIALKVARKQTINSQI